MTNLYYSTAQCVAHHAASGCNMNPGDMLGTGTISAPTDDGLGALVEMNQAGKKVAFQMADGEDRKFFKDGDEVNITASC